METKIYQHKYRLGQFYVTGDGYLIYLSNKAKIKMIINPEDYLYNIREEIVESSRLALLSIHGVTVEGLLGTREPEKE